MQLCLTPWLDANCSSAYLFILRVTQISFNQKKCIASTSGQPRTVCVINSNNRLTFLVVFLSVYFYARSRCDACRDARVIKWNAAMPHPTCARAGLYRGFISPGVWFQFLHGQDGTWACSLPEEAILEKLVLRQMWFLMALNQGLYFCVRGPHMVIRNSSQAGQLTSCDCFGICYILSN